MKSERNHLKKFKRKTLFFPQPFSTRFCAFTLFQYEYIYLSKVYNETFLVPFLMRAVGAVSNLWLSKLTTSKIVCCWQRRNICIFIACRVFASRICISMILLCFTILRFVQLVAAVKFLPLQPYGGKHFLVKTANENKSSQIWDRPQIANPMYDPPKTNAMGKKVIKINSNIYVLLLKM